MIRNKIKGIGEIVLRVNDMEVMKAFYQKTLGLDLMRDSKDYVFFKIADGYGGHTQTLALFARENKRAFDEDNDSVESNHTSLHHLALEIDLKDYEETLDLLRKKNIEVITKIFEWVQWRSIFIRDPESNIIEFVCYDADIYIKP